MPVMEKRRFRRFAVHVPCFVKHAHSRAPQSATRRVIPAETRDISRGGLSLVMNADWKVGTEIECVIQLQVQPAPQKPVEIECRGKIVRVNPQERGGFEVGASIEQFSYLYPQSGGTLGESLGL
jgi:hypothetical protein